MVHRAQRLARHLGLREPRVHRRRDGQNALPQRNTSDVPPRAALRHGRKGQLLSRPQRQPRGDRGAFDARGQARNAPDAHVDGRAVSLRQKCDAREPCQSAGKHVTPDICKGHRRHRWFGSQYARARRAHDHVELLQGPPHRHRQRADAGVHLLRQDLLRADVQRRLLPLVFDGQGRTHVFVHRLRGRNARIVPRQGARRRDQGPRLALGKRHAELRHEPV